jgi:hypothetical protein
VIADCSQGYTRRKDCLAGFGNNDRHVGIGAGRQQSDHDAVHGRTVGCHHQERTGGMTLEEALTKIEAVEAALNRYVQIVDPDDEWAVETIQAEDRWRLVRDLRAALNSGDVA